MNKNLKKIILSLFAVLFLSTAYTSCAKEILNPEGGLNVVVEGVVYKTAVTDPETGNVTYKDPIPNVKVTSNYGSTRTNSKGEFTILASVEFYLSGSTDATLSFECDGYKPIYNEKVDPYGSKKNIKMDEK